MQTQIEALKAENDRLRRDNERFVRIIDSGEWGRGRVAELVQVLPLPCVPAVQTHSVVHSQTDAWGLATEW